MTLQQLKNLVSSTSKYGYNTQKCGFWQKFSQASLVVSAALFLVPVDRLKNLLQPEEPNSASCRPKTQQLQENRESSFGRCGSTFVTNWYDKKWQSDSQYEVHRAWDVKVCLVSKHMHVHCWIIERAFYTLYKCCQALCLWKNCSAWQCW